MATRKLDLSGPLLNANDVAALKDDKNVDLSLGKFLGDRLLAPGKENVRKFYDWGMDLWKKGIITVDKADTALLTAFVEAQEDWPVLYKGRLLEKINP